MLPDADVLGFRFGVAYAAPWGHRGATHSIAFCAILAALIGTLSRALRLNITRTTAFAAVVLLSHPLLDTLTDGGLGCALLWPFDNQRYFAPWNPIPVAPIGLRYFSEAGLAVALSELILFSPLLVYALWPIRPEPSDATPTSGEDRA